MADIACPALTVVALTLFPVLAAPDSIEYSSSSTWHTVCSEPSHHLHTHTAYHLQQP